MSPNFSFLARKMAEILPTQTRKKEKKTSGVKTEYSLPSPPGGNVVHRLDMELGRSCVQHSQTETRKFIEHLTPHSLESKGQGWGLQAANLIGRNDVKCHNILSKCYLTEGF